MQRQYWTYNRQLLPALRENGLDIVEKYGDLTEEEKAFVDKYFENEVFPVLTPMAVDNSRPFPLVRNKSLNLCALLTRKEGTGQGIPGYLRKVKKSERAGIDPRDVKEAKALRGVRDAAELREVLEEKAAKSARNARAAGDEKGPGNAEHIAEGRDEKGSKSAKDNKDAKASKELKAGKEVKNPKSGKEGKGAKEGKGKFQFATVQVPAVLPRILELPESPGARRIIFLEEIIRHHLGSLFLNYDVVCAYPYRVTRNADLTIDEDDASDLLKEIEKQLKKRQRGYAIRLEVQSGMDARLLAFLQKEFQVLQDHVYEIEGPLDLTFLMKVYGLEGIEWLRDQVRLIRPKIIVCLGRIAAGRIIKSDIKITKEHGIWFEKNGILMMAMLHPVAILRDPRRKPDAFDDFLKLRDKINEVCEHTYY
jgi:hypothetical protein